MQDRIPHTYDDLFREIGTAECIEPWTLKAVALMSSNLVADAHRFGRGDRRFYKRFIEDKPRWMSHRYYNSPEVLAGTWGLMQMRYPHAILVGFPFEGDIEELIQPAINVRMATRYLRMLATDLRNMSAALAKYHAGSPQITDEGHFANAWYVDRVWRLSARFEKEMKAAIQSVPKS